LTRGPNEPNPRPNVPRSRPTGPTPWLAGQVLTRFSPRLRGHVSTREEEGQGGGSHSTRLVNHVPRLAGCHLASYCLGQVGGVSPRPYKYPHSVEIRTHAPHFGNSNCKALILSVVARHSLVRRVARL
jgi:hypothetical protein